MIITAQAPTRIDLAGGTIDLWPLYLFHKNAQTINVAIDQWAKCRMESRQDSRIVIESIDRGHRAEFDSLPAVAESGPLELLQRLVKHFAPAQGLTLTTEATAPAGAGLGGSSALNIAVCGALNEFTDSALTEEEILKIAMDVETQVIRVPAGIQDYYSALYGGASAIQMQIGKVRREALAVDQDRLEEHLLLCYTGVPRNSGINNWEVYKRHVDAEREIFELFERIVEATEEMRRVIESGEYQGVANALDREWSTRRQLAPGISTPLIEQLFSEAKKAGALAGKVCGAGGGGCVVLAVDPERKEEVVSAATQLGVEVLPFRIVQQGLQVTRRT